MNSMQSEQVSGKWSAALVPWLVPMVGLVVGVWLLGFHAINPLNVDWMKGDVAQSYLGWAYFHQTSDWGFPLTFTPRLNYPTGCLISYNNSLPLLAVLLKPFAQYLPREFQFQGAFALGCAIFQAIFGYALCRRFTSDEWKALLGCLFIVTAPPFVVRYSFDIVLLCQWPILAAIWLSLKPERDGNAWSLPLRYSLILIFAGGINPYLAVMCLMVMSAATYRDVWESKPFALKRLPLWLIPVGTLLVTWIVFGFLKIGGDGMQNGLGGYGEASMNLLSPINPRLDPSGWVAETSSIVFKDRDTFPLQYEGYNYLGAGVIFLIAGTLIFGRGLKQIVADPVLKPLWVVAAVSFAMAVTTKVTLGRHVLIDVPLPYHPVKQTLSMFRASGRFFWPAYYVILVAFLQFAFRSSSRRRILVVLSVLFCLQMVDTYTLHRRVHAALNPPPGDPMFKDGFWEKASGRFDKLVVLPAWQTFPNDSSLPGGEESWMHFGFLAAKYGMALNLNYQARPSAKDDEIQRHVLPASVTAGTLADDTLYVLGPRFLIGFCDSEFTHIASKSVDHMLVFWKDQAAPENLERLKALLRETLERGIDVKEVADGFEFPQHPIAYQFDRGFELPEGKYFDSVGKRSEIPIFLSRISKISKISIEMKPWVGRDVVSQSFRVSLGGQPLGEYSLKNPGIITIEIPPEVIKAIGRLEIVPLSFDWDTAAATEQVIVRNESTTVARLRKWALAVGFKSGLKGDTRLWAAGIRAMRIQTDE